MAVVDYKKEGRVAIFTINRPEARNSLSFEVHERLYEGMINFRDDPDLWVAIITGAGDRAFCAGQDIKGMRPGMGGVVVEEMKAYNVADTIWKPFIAAINGYALGGGLELALTCDIRIAAEHARFGQPEITIGAIPGGGGTQRLPRFVSRSQAAEILLMGQMIDAQEAYRIGLVNKVVPLDQLMPTAMQWAETICHASPVAVRGSKEAMIRGYSLPLKEGLQVERELFVRVTSSEDSAEGMRAFVEKRKPVWKGK